MLDPPPQAAALSLCTPAGPLSPSHPAVLEIKVPLPARRARPGRIPGTQRAERALTPCWAGKDRAPACWGGGAQAPPLHPDQELMVCNEGNWVLWGGGGRKNHSGVQHWVGGAPGDPPPQHYLHHAC